MNESVVCETKFDIGRFGQMRHQYLKNHRKIMFVNLLTSGKLHEHIHEIDQTSSERFELIVTQMAKAENVTEELKSHSQMEWVGRMNNIRNRAEEIVRKELIYA